MRLPNDERDPLGLDAGDPRAKPRSPKLDTLYRLLRPQERAAEETRVEIAEAEGVERAGIN